jgi:hypothetical protein
MQAVNIWHLFDLRRAQIICLLSGLALLGSYGRATAQGQGYVRKHLEFYDDKPIHFGFLFAMPVTRYVATPSDAYVSDSTLALYSPASTAFRMGFTINKVLSEHFDIRTTPSVTLYGRTLTYEYPNKKVDKVRESTWVEVPLLLKYKSKRRVNTRMYLLTGVTLGFETNVKNKIRFGAEQLNTRRSDITLDYGVGLERFFEFFKLAPELRFSHGLVNMIPDSGVQTMQGVRRLTSHAVTLYLNFE